LSQKEGHAKTKKQTNGRKEGMRDALLAGRQLQLALRVVTEGRMHRPKSRQMDGWKERAMNQTSHRVFLFESGGQLAVARSLIVLVAVCGWLLCGVGH
jgi:hypothetical protein